MRCPICHKEFEPLATAAMPFCSERCRTIDLGRWLGEAYSLPEIVDPDADEGPPVAEGVAPSPAEPDL
jgi:endogenous inhibitor of DNA gyrase (YacG/DUF329 family)